MATSNEVIRDALIRHQIRLLRFSKSLERELLALLVKPNARLRDHIEALLRRFPASGFRAASAEKQIAAFAGLIAKLYTPLQRQSLELLRAQLLDMAVREVAFTRQLILGSLPVITAIELVKKRALRSMVRTVPHDGLPLTGWNSRLWEGDLERILRELRTGLLFDESRAQILRRVFGTRALKGADGIRAMTLRNAQTLSRTLVNSVANQAREQLYEANNIVEEELFVATLDRRTTAICRATDGEVFPKGEGLIPPLHRNCRSLRVPVVAGERLGTRPANAATERELRGLRGPERREAVSKMVGQVPETQTYAEFLANQSVQFQNEALGVTKARLYRDGGLTLDRFVDASGNELTLLELYELEQEAFVRAGIPRP